MSEYPKTLYITVFDRDYHRVTDVLEEVVESEEEEAELRDYYQDWTGERYSFYNEDPRLK